MDTWQAIWQVLQEDFSDLPSVAACVRVVVRLAVAAALGALMGWERELAHKPAGLRTYILVAVGAALFLLVPQQMGVPLEHLSRVMQGLVVGIGFLGAGTILKLTEERTVHGLTTAAGIWMTAAVGMAAGLGREMTAIVGTLVAFLVLAGLRRLEALFEGRQGGPTQGL
jgi:putative Mg2+ transporter-C (MgtC) family protein